MAQLRVLAGGAQPGWPHFTHLSFWGIAHRTTGHGDVELAAAARRPFAGRTQKGFRVQALAQPPSAEIKTISVVAEDLLAFASAGRDMIPTTGPFGGAAPVPWRHSSRIARLRQPLEYLKNT